jgi:hypothetical protein
MADISRDGEDLCAEEHISLCEALDRVLHKGALIQGDITISVADIDLIYLGLRVMLCSVDTAERVGAYETRGRRLEPRFFENTLPEFEKGNL